MALYLRDGTEDSNIKGLVEHCAHADDITPLVRLVFEAQALADSPATIAADGQQMVAIISGALGAVAGEQALAIDDICHSNATSIAQTVAELGAVHSAVEDVKARLVAGNADVQAAGLGLVDNIRKVTQLSDVADNLGKAAAAVQAARGVLEQCVAAGRLIDEQQLYRALCMLDKIRRKHLAALLDMLSQRSMQPSSSSSGAAGGASSGSSKRLTAKDAEHLQLLHSFFSRLVDDMAAAVQRLALQGFNQWLVSMRACARELGMKAIQAAAVERSLEEDLARERKAILAALTGPGSKSVNHIAAELVQAQFRQDLLKDAAEKEARDSSGGGSAAADGADEADDDMVARSGSSISSLGSLLRRPGRKSQPASKQQQQQPAVPLELPELDQLHPGDPAAAIRALVQRQQLLSRGSSTGQPGRLRQQQDQQQQRKPVRSLLDLDMSGLHTAVHVSRSLGQLDSFRQHYLEQRRLQLAADLQPPSSFLEGYQAYLAQITGFFVVESFVQRVSPELVGPGEGGLLWGGALRVLVGALEAALPQLGSAPLMLMVKDFVVLVAGALERAGYQVAPVTEVLLAGRGRYHDLLAAQLQSQLAAAVEGDVLSELEVRSESQHRQLVQELGLPWALEGAAAAGGRRLQLGPSGLPPLPYPAPYTCSVPEVLELSRRFVADSLAFLRGLYSPWELLPAVLNQRDRMLSKVLVEVLSAKAASVASEEMLRESMKCAANAWALGAALDALDDWTISQARPSYAAAAAAAAVPSPAAASQAGSPGKASSAAATAAAAAAAAAKLTRARNRKAVLASGALSNTVQAALQALQDAAERNVLRSLTNRIEQLLAGSRKGDWQPPEPLPATQSSWVDALLSSLQETFEAGSSLLPRSTLVNLMRRALRATATASMRAFGPEGVKGYNLYAIERLAVNLATIERFASRWGVASLAEELAEPNQLCKLLLSNKVEDITVPQLRRQHYPALDPAVVAAALDRFREAPQQAKKHPQWPTKKTIEGVARQLREPPQTPAC